MACVFLIRRPEIDDNLARGATDHHPEVVKLADLFKDRRILVFGISIVLFHFANAAMLPLVGQKLTAGKSEGVALDMSYCIIAAQLVMVPVAIVASRLAESWGRRPVFLIGFAVLPIRGLFYTVTNNPTASTSASSPSPPSPPPPSSSTPWQCPRRGTRSRDNPSFS